MRLTHIHKCHQCPRHTPPRPGKGILCEVDGRNIREHAAEDDCPLGFFTPGAQISLSRSGIYRPIAAPSAASPRLIAARQMRCNGCEHKNGTTCNLCGCQLAAKVRDCDSGCPAGKWSAVIPENREVWFSHTGAIGDILYAIPGMRIAAGGRPFSLYIHHDAAVRPADYMTPAKVAALEPLLLAQPDILHVEHTDPWPTATHRLDTFRDLDIHKLDLVTLHCMALGVEPPARIEPWLTVPKKNPVAKVIFHRSPRYANPLRKHIWDELRKAYPDAVFVGHPQEYSEFCREAADPCNDTSRAICQSTTEPCTRHRFTTIPYYPTNNLLELAEVIAGADLFVGNQSSPFAIATGLGVPTVLEVDPRIPNCCFKREGALDLWSPAQLLPHEPPI